MSIASTAAAEGQSTEARAGKKRRSRSIFGRLTLWLVLLAGIAAAAVYGNRWWTAGRFIQSTDDAYIRADDVAVAPRVSGYVAEVMVRDNQAVEAGQPIARIEADTYKAVLERQRATADARQADVAAAEAHVQQQLASVEQAKAKLAGSQISARYAAQEAERYKKLSASGAETAERLTQMVNNRDQANATVQADMAALSVAEREVETLKVQVRQAQAQVEAAQAAVHEADLDVGHALVRASIAGHVGDRSVRVGQYVQPGTRMLSIVPVQNIYVVANFKETQIGGMKIGQAATISVDALDGRALHGTLESFAPGTGSQFALLPPENATGNFIKITQRVPVRFRIDADDTVRAMLIPGLSVTVDVDTRGAGAEPKGAH